MALTLHLGINGDSHFAIRLVSHHFSENGRANRTFDPLLVTHHVLQAMLMIDMGAWKCINILISILH
jgi:hypothetical protein